jgi:hypothetical protein
MRFVEFEYQGYKNEPNDVHVHSQKLINYAFLKQTRILAEKVKERNRNKHKKEKSLKQRWGRAEK